MKKEGVPNLSTKPLVDCEGIRSPDKSTSRRFVRTGGKALRGPQQTPNRLQEVFRPALVPLLSSYTRR